MLGAYTFKISLRMDGGPANFPPPGLEALWWDLERPGLEGDPGTGGVEAGRGDVFIGGAADLQTFPHLV